MTRPAVDVAPHLLGAVVTSDLGGHRVSAVITEVEAYHGEQDPASHAFRGPTKRNAVMFGPAGHLYCYFVYGMHWCANVTCDAPGAASAVLLRAGRVVVGEDVVRLRAPRQDGGPSALPTATLASGPARLARALGLSGAHTGLDLLATASPVRLRRLGVLPEYRSGPRVGITVGVDAPWRFWLADDPSVSSFRAGRRRRRLGADPDNAPDSESR
ncbi:DNA-3-methyladenine glycosylase [Jatrophihabitans telluris]|uniref:Putative 3-methyladenine DNA glycosylase n=1 Tax=Jatrophihabitans telluris TaxID=2038343 RepID=A0ABY4R2F7_9ACTN|nr:DNA-3-methyladenine glycosylase [Jatrophihabitans telluris]